MVRKIILNNNKGIVLVDDEDYKELSMYKWYLKAVGNGYATTKINIGNKWINKYIHHFLLNNPKGFEIDHIDGNGLNNQKDNLRIVTRTQNLMNRKKYKGTSIHKGVHWRKDCKKWQALININKKQCSLGCFIKEIDAAIAYNDAAIKYFKNYAILNIID